MRNLTSINRQLREKIIPLKGTMSYRKIAKLVNCSKSSVNYYLSEGAAEKIKSREGRREWRKVWRYCYEKGKPKNPPIEKFSKLRKIGRSFLYGTPRNMPRSNRMGLKNKSTKLLDCLKLIWPKLTKAGMTKENKPEQAINQWTKKLDFYDDGKPVMTPYARCKLSDEIVNVKSSETEVDHINGDRTDNNPGNFSLVKSQYNQMKSDVKDYEQLYDRTVKLLNTLEKYKPYWKNKRI
tara:strand:+ start:42 stop:752 length:711 start_codon:yes stop_codon:yes gene_type:complete